jgi:hypothetical protein
VILVLPHLMVAMVFGSSEVAGSLVVRTGLFIRVNSA